jgi:hypothetical protein
MIWSLALFSLALSAAPARNPNVEEIFKRVEALELQQQNKDAGEIRALDKKIEALTPQVLRLGFLAVAPLAAIAQDPKRSDKTRIWALNFLALTHDPASLAPLKAVLDDAKAPELCREAAASAINSVDISAVSRRQALCDSAAKDLPPEALREALYALKIIGCDDPAVLERRAKEFGGKPDAKEAVLVDYAIDALGRSHPVESARALWRVFAFFPKGSPQRLETLKQLLLQSENLHVLGAVALDKAKDALNSESDAPANAVAAANLLDSFNEPATANLFLRFLKNKDAEVATRSAEALAHLREKKARNPIADMVAHANDDPRFAPAANRPDPRELLARLQKALDAINKLP